MTELLRGHIGDAARKTHLTYDSNGQSKGIATCIVRGRAAALSVQREFDRRVIDGTRRLKVELILSSSSATLAAVSSAPLYAGIQSRDPAPASARRRSAHDRKKALARSSGAVQPRTDAGKHRKTAAELDAEMDDYFEKVQS